MTQPPPVFTELVVKWSFMFSYRGRNGQVVLLAMVTGDRDDEETETNCYVTLHVMLLFSVFSAQPFEEVPLTPF